jgi:hypothetical protein
MRSIEVFGAPFPRLYGGRFRNSGMECTTEEQSSHDGVKLGILFFLLSLDALKGVSIFYFVTMNLHLHLVISLFWLPQSGFYLEVLKGFPLRK